MTSEFDLIRTFFTRPAHKAVLGVGDDCALLMPDSGCELAISTDMLVEGRHFPADTDAASVGWKALAVNLSDLAAMGAKPLAFTLALALPRADELWIERFASGLFECADRFDCELIGGDTTRGPLNLCITVLGEIPQGQAIRRSGARPGDDLWVSGNLGDAALGLLVRQGQAFVSDVEQAAVQAALDRPLPRVALGQALRGIASAMIDISDGLSGDLGHILAASGQGAALNVDALPISTALDRQSAMIRLQCALTGGDDYELCFTAPSAQRAAVIAAARTAQVSVTRIGHIETTLGLRLTDNQGRPYALPEGLVLQSFDHFVARS